MLEYDFVSLETEWGTGYNLLGGVRIDTSGHREIIAQRAADGWRWFHCFWWWYCAPGWAWGRAFPGRISGE